ncbi:MAG TPA: pyruvate formate lyase family protein [Desulfomonilia bacterium]
MNKFRTDASVFAFKMSLKALAAIFSTVPRFRREIYNTETGCIFNARFQFKTRDEKVHVYMIFDNGKVRTGTGIIENPDTIIAYRDKETLARLFAKNPEESIDYLLTNEMSSTGNMSYLTKFSYLSTLIAGGGKKKNIVPSMREVVDIDKGAKRRRMVNEKLGRKVDTVQVLDDPYLEEYTLEDFPRLKYLKNRRFAMKPALCVERAQLLTRYHREYGFEHTSSGAVFDANLRQAHAMRYCMENKRPIIHERHLIPGSTTSKEVGVPIYPEFIGTLIWPELKSISTRDLNPCDLTPEEADILNREVFPFWAERNIREHTRKRFGNPLSQQLEERFVLYFMMKNNAISHTVPDFKTAINEGLISIRDKAYEKETKAHTHDKKNFYQAVQVSIDGVLCYAQHLSREAMLLASTLNPEDPAQAERITELTEMARICAKVPAGPAESVYEAIISIWICFTCLQIENANSALSIGRLDQLLQPFFMKDIAKAATDDERRAIVKKTIELVASLFMRFNDHDPLVPSTGNKLFGGTSSDDTVTVGGIDSEGNNAVNDMTYIILKAAEMLCFQDPNMNAKYYPGVNSKEYLRRLCEVNLNMAASPIIQNDKAMIEVLVNEGIPLADARDWSATGCVEPTITGRHYGHTNCMMLNLVAPLEMALNNGVHPVMGEKIGPETGDARYAFPEFEDFLAAYKTQLKYLMELSVEINNYMGCAHQEQHPTPLLSAMMDGTMEKGCDIIFGGAKYNTSGVALVSISDVIDSLMVIKNLIYKQKKIDFSTLLDALAADFAGFEDVERMIGRVPKFGSGEEEPIAMAHDIMDFCYDYFTAQKNYRGGVYWPGYWSNSYHVGFGMLSGALPSGRKKGKAFTPGLTPAPGSSDNLLENIRTVAALDNFKMPNNLSFNVKLVPHPGDSHGRTLDIFSGYVQSYFDLGGMQWQCNMISSDTMRDAMANPDEYRWLIVRISGYNAYFVKLNRNMQEELIERAEFACR